MKIFLVPGRVLPYHSIHTNVMEGIIMPRNGSILPPNVDKILEKLESFMGSLSAFLADYLPLFGRSTIQANAQFFLKGLLSDLSRKTAEPIAEIFGLERKTMQRFVGIGSWNDALIEDCMIKDISENLGTSDGVLSVDPSSVPKQGNSSVGVGRQYSGHEGKVDNCQVGVFMSYASSKGHTLIDKQLYLPKNWAKNWKRRKKAKVPKKVAFKKKWELGDEMLQAHASAFPHRWITSDSEFGRVGEWRDRLNARGEQYAVDIPSNTVVHYSVKGDCLQGAWKVSELVDTHNPSDWTRFEVRKTANGVKYVDAFMEQVFTEREDGTLRREILFVTKTVETKPQIRFSISNAPSNTPLSAFVRVRDRHWLIEDCFKRGKSDVGLDQYEVRSWVGWHHHMTLSILALWFLEKERSRHGSVLFPPHRTNAGIHHCRDAPNQGFGSAEFGKKGMEAYEKECPGSERSSEACPAL